MMQLLILALTLMLVSMPLTAAEKLVIAHRGASAYLPEHTLEAKVLAHAQGADYLEQDVVMTRDNALVVLHDLTLERISDVASRYPRRAREDGHYYVIDFDLDELRTLSLGEAVDNGIPVYPQRFPPGASRFSIHTLAEELQLIQGLNTTLQRQAGIYVEVKSPWFHHQHGRDLSLAVLQELQRYGYDSKKAPVYLQSFDYHELQRIRHELLPRLGMELKLIQLIAENSWQETFAADAGGTLQPYDYSWMLQSGGLQRLAELVDGIGPQFAMLVETVDGGKHYRDKGLVRQAHHLGMAVHPYTFRAEAEQLPGYADSLEDLLYIFLHELDVDGVFTDFPDRAAALYRTLQP